MADLRHSTGKHAEDLAAAYLVGLGFTIHHRNYRCRQGEIDIVARDGSTWVFVEVRSRTTFGFGQAVDTIDHRKRQKLLQAARYFLKEWNLSEYDTDYRFDVVAFDGPKRQRFISHFVNIIGN